LWPLLGWTLPVPYTNTKL